MVSETLTDLNDQNVTSAQSADAGEDSVVTVVEDATLIVVGPVAVHHVADRHVVTRDHHHQDVGDSPHLVAIETSTFPIVDETATGPEIAVHHPADQDPFPAARAGLFHPAAHDHLLGALVATLHQVAPALLHLVVLVASHHSVAQDQDQGLLLLVVIAVILRQDRDHPMSAVLTNPRVEIDVDRVVVTGNHTDMLDP